LKLLVDLIDGLFLTVFAIRLRYFLNEIILSLNLLILSCEITNDVIMAIARIGFTNSLLGERGRLHE
jgi:hypothetical protein